MLSGLVRFLCRFYCGSVNFSRNAVKLSAASATALVSWFRNTIWPVWRSMHHALPKGSIAMAT